MIPVTLEAGDETLSVCECWLWVMLNRHRPKFDARAPALRARSITLHTIQRAHDARRELLLIVPLTVLTIVAG